MVSLAPWWIYMLPPKCFPTSAARVVPLFLFRQTKRPKVLPWTSPPHGPRRLRCPRNLPENAPGCDPRWRSRGAQAKPSLNLGGVGGAPGVLSSLRLRVQSSKAEDAWLVQFVLGGPKMEELFEMGVSFFNFPPI